MRLTVYITLLVVSALSRSAHSAPMDNNAYVLTPLGFSQPGVLKIELGARAGLLHLLVRDRARGQPTACRLNVVGLDGNFYQLCPIGLVNTV